MTPRTMTPRIANPQNLAPAAMKAMLAVEGTLRASGLEKRLLELVKMRVSQINGCAYCLAMHATAARRDGETEMRLYMLDAWRESGLYSERERAALGWTEVLTRIVETRAPDDDYARLRAAFTETEQVHLTLQIGTINLWNRLQVGLRAAPEAEGVRDAA